ncbi:MAG: LysM peptidoglycan-binding domain-containing protein [Acetobacteraceae bacterium]|nr:LysM peptidoglycan-binding domain-containing protein [Acetobacteraceae bacterium]
MTKLVKAKLIELEQDFKNEKSGGKSVEVQFNPETLKVTFANQLVQPQGGDQAAGNTGRQFVGAGTTKLALTLWFDVTAMTENAVDDVRRLTQNVIFFMTPTGDKQDKKKMVAPATRFVWGSFLFDGIVEGLEESLEFFGADGKPLRASIGLTLSQQKILATEFKGQGRVPSTPGRAPLSAAKSGDSVQSLAAANGNADWKAIATANNIEDPLRLQPGQLLDLQLSTPALPGLQFSAT